MLKYFLILLIASCSRQVDYSYLNEDRRQLPKQDKYQAWVDIYSSDTTVLGKRVLWAQWYEPAPAPQSDMFKYQLGRICSIDSIQYTYYKRADTLIYKSPLGQTKMLPLRTDTNWYNYNR